MAAAFSKALGKPVAPVFVPSEGFVGALEQAGLPPDRARLYAEMYAGMIRGRVAFQGPTVKGRIAIEETVRHLV